LLGVFPPKHNIAESGCPDYLKGISKRPNLFYNSNKGIFDGGRNAVLCR
jgi:hypothetical protein